MIGTSCVVRQQQHKGTVLLSRRWPMDVGQERGRRRAVGFWGYWGGMWLLRFRVPPAVALLQPLHCCRPGARSPLPGLAVYHRDTPASWQGLVHTLIQVPRLEIVTPPKASLMCESLAFCDWWGTHLQQTPASPGPGFLSSLLKLPGPRPSSFV